MSSSKPSATVADGKVVAIHYTLKDDEGDVLDSSQGGGPLFYLHGASNIVPGLESELNGYGVGEKLKVDVAPKDAYGERQGPGPQAVPRDAFPDGVDVAAGMQFMAEDDKGNDIPLWVLEVQDDAVVVDINHPLAGATLHFEVEITEIRDATEEELQHGHPHGPGEHHH